MILSFFYCLVVVGAFQATFRQSSLIELHKDITEIDSEVGNEYDVVHFLAGYLSDHGLTVELQTVAESRENIYAYIGSSRDTKVLLTSHIDTNPAGKIPYHVIGNEIHVRGACDAKGSVASQIFAFLELQRDGIITEGDLGLLFVVGEEYDGSGSLAAVTSLNATWSNAVVVGEPTENKLSVGHKGNFRFDVNAIGVASHSGYPEQGFSAVEFLMRRIELLLDTAFPHSNLLGPTTVNIGTFHGGISANLLAPSAKAEIYIRVADDINLVNDTVNEIFTTSHSNYSIVQMLEPQYLDYDIPGFETVACSYATDIPYFKRPGVKRYLYGPGSILVAHSPKEYLTVEDLYESVEGYKAIVQYNI
ncbi:hypothetical protein OGAPHI_000895 [Ogataea philodendri]|uniref:Peptidase M20 dimerisation domain-containing protein n=1 Tax=Ogataea philodendri TaxID=1378263 RepID=A0A9P8PEV9_9ASCO|nr:uncharacterized protein OGAPHI_000895 [Ogataea philodendri]KAH3670380.1 hypothetical protein OGAPHI_000895 [Ogataea philodendri]